MPRARTSKQCKFLGCSMTTEGEHQRRDIARHERTCRFNPKNVDVIELDTENEPENAPTTSIGPLPNRPEIQENIREDNTELSPLTTPVVRRNIVTLPGIQPIPVARLQRVIGVVSTMIPTSVQCKSVVYLLCIGYDPTTEKFIFKFGMTTDYKKRKSDHDAEYAYLVEIFVISLGNFCAKGAEDTIKGFSEVMTRSLDVTVIKNVGGVRTEKTHREMFGAAEAEFHLVTKAIFDLVCKVHRDQIEATYVAADVASSVDEVTQRLKLEIDLAKEKSKVAEAPSTLAKENNRRCILDLMKAHPDKFDDLVKVLASFD